MNSPKQLSIEFVFATFNKKRDINLTWEKEIIVTTGKEESNSIKISRMSEIIKAM